MATKHPGGRPLKFKSVEELQEKVDAYFADCDPHPEEITLFKWIEVEENYTDSKGKQKTRKVQDRTQPPKLQSEWHISESKPYTITGLANFLETSRRTLINYEDRDEFFHTIKAAKDKCEEWWELQLLGSHATGPIFNLKNNFEWKDQTQTDITSDGEKLGVTLSADQTEQLLRARTNRTDI